MATARAPPRARCFATDGRHKDRETKLWTNKGAEETRVSLRGAVSDEAISVFGQRLLRSARNDTLTLCHAVGGLSYSPKQSIESIEFLES